MNLDKIIEKLTEQRLESLRELDKERTTLSDLSNKTGHAVSTTNKNLKAFSEMGLATRDSNKVWYTTEYGSEFIDRIDDLKILLRKPDGVK